MYLKESKTDHIPDQSKPVNVAPVNARGTGWHEVYLDGSPEAEADLFRQYAGEIQEIQNRTKGYKGQTPVRALHAKQRLGLAKAEFHISLDLPPELRRGFLQPGATYRATVRFSNASGLIQPDAAPDLRGLAVRVHLDEGTDDEASHDFLATNAPVNHARDARQFMAAAQALAGRRKIEIIPRLIWGLGWGEGWRVFNCLSQSASGQVASLAAEQFWSRAPFAIGPYAVKFKFQPDAAQTLPPANFSAPPGDDYLREEISQRLQAGPVRFDFKVQRYIDEVKTPLEDGAIEWREEDAPFETIAHLVIPAQDLTAAAARQSEAEIERLSFTPWNTTGEFRPLGSLNRARRSVYAASAAQRLADQAQRTPQPVKRLPLLERVFNMVNRSTPWHKLPTWVAILNLIAIRNRLRRDNLYDTESKPRLTLPAGTTHDPRLHCQRTLDGSYNDLRQPQMGAAGSRFGRNIPPAADAPILPTLSVGTQAARTTQAQPDPNLLTPSPREISRRLLARDTFKPVESLNLLATAWIQFQVHDWFNHERKRRSEAQASDLVEIPLVPEDDWYENPMRVVRTPPDLSESEKPQPLPTYANTETHWWDASQLYGSQPEITARLRSYRDGKLKLNDEGLLPFEPETGLELTGFNENWWVGLSLMHTLFSLEHNAICDRLRADYPIWNDEQLFHKARLINAALLAKIHTIEWTPAILSHPALQIGMNANWWGLVGRKLHDLAGRISDNQVIRGIPGSPTTHHGVPYTLTEEFVAVYRMHPLIPDEFSFFSHNDHTLLAEKTLPEIVGSATGEIMNTISMSDLLYSFGLAHPGAITLHNYPRFLRQHARLDGEIIDLAAIDILRDRERGLPRYNKFRQLFHLPRVNSFEALTDNPVWAAELRQVYHNDIDSVDLMVGMYAENPPQGFGFSDTAFRVFALMASRRLESDRFLTTDFTSEVYTPVGLAWVQANGMKNVLLRHFPELGPALAGGHNTFAPWQRAQSARQE